ncbi:RING-H2 FINGER PROTEIN ATL4J [Salix koriyanagi]|uniref:RING-H2 FINGER PROTEIN ATL4J n=1 Tax=Salix koriyanagi TaxID=2511006 RepID=A0A9Q0VBB9_9ROSI|nr:RING-H2 FINGER PROTEIN ATL4J [Salix koriyanagi]
MSKPKSITIRIHQAIFNLHRQNLHGLARSNSRFSGIDEEVIKSLPFFRFSSLRGSKEGPGMCKDPNLEIFVEREHGRQVSSTCFNPGSSFQNSDDSSRNEEFLIQAGGNADDRNRKLFHKFMHKIVISDVLVKSRWSDANSSDFLSLNTEMLRDMSSNKFSPQKSSSARFHNGLSSVENLENPVKDDTERKTLCEPQLTTVDRSNSVPSSGLKSSKKPNPAWKRSVSEVTIFSRFRQLSVRNKMRESTSLGKDERTRMLWLPLARRTIQWFAGRERNSRQSEYERQASNV